MTHFATADDEQSPAETELASVLAAEAAMINGFVVFVLLVGNARHHTASFLVAVLEFVADAPIAP